MIYKYINDEGLNYLWGKIKAYVSGFGFYTKPSTGIPASDMASGVIPTVPSNVSAFTNDAGYTTNTGTVTSVTMNGSTYSPTSGDVDLGTVITSHQSLSDYVQKSQTSGLLKNDGTVDTTVYTTNTGTVTSTGGTVAVNNIQVVSALPASPDANTLYLIPET